VDPAGVRNVDDVSTHPAGFALPGGAAFECLPVIIPVDNIHCNKLGIQGSQQEQLQDQNKTS